MPTEAAVNHINDYYKLMMYDETETYQETEVFQEHNDWNSGNTGAFWL